jgi:uncharacterized membrane protein
MKPNLFIFQSYIHNFFVTCGTTKNFEKHSFLCLITYITVPLCTSGVTFFLSTFLGLFVFYRRTLEHIFMSANTAQS